ncbi:uncharacterized protein LOC134253016 [Saccostrea cucullata]|uniref:uncharacterized protein LOC134253016 n=1 Tax=Saccostrea cuccullata TaxID=36930 RepID=UPI002ED186E5
MVKNKKDIAKMRVNGVKNLKEYQKQIKNSLESLNEFALQNEKIFQSMDFSHFTKYESNIQKYLKIPPQIDLELPAFVSKDIDKGKLYQDFGKIIEPKIQIETIYRSDVSNELLDKAVEIASFHTGITPLMRMACLNTEEVWITRRNKTITLINIQGSTTSQITAPQGWQPLGLCCTQSGDLMVSIRTFNFEHYKVVLYEGKKIKQEIEKDDQGKPLYKGGNMMLFVSQNNNGDICASDCNAKVVVVVNNAERLRFRYKGQQTMKKQFAPTTIVTDSAGRIIIKDKGNFCIHIIDQDGQFLRSLDFCGALCLDTLGRLWVGDNESGIVKVIKYTK